MTFDMQAKRDLAMRCAFYDPMPEEILPEFVAALDEIARQYKAATDYEDELIAALEDAGVSMGDNEQPQDTITAIGILGHRIETQAKRIADLEQKLLTSECRERDAGQRISELEAVLSHAQRVIVESQKVEAQLRERIAEYHEHERQTHEILGGILGKDTSLEDGARRAMNRIAELEGNLSDYKKIARDLDADLTKKSKYSDKQRAALKILGQRAGKRGKALIEAKAKICRNALPCVELCSCENQHPRTEFKDCPNKDRWRQIAREQLRREKIL